MYMQKPPVRLYWLAGMLFFCMAVICFQLLRAVSGEQIAQASVRQGKYHLHVPLSGGIIYDRHFTALNAEAEAPLAVINPTPETLAAVFTKLRDRSAVNRNLPVKTPFICELTEDAEPNQNLFLLHGRKMKTGAVPAQHLLGYRQNGAAVTGLEKAYETWLSSCEAYADVTFTVSARGDVLPGAESRLEKHGTVGGGVVTTLDADIQRITEQVLRKAAPDGAAAVVLDAQTGAIRACASTPLYDPAHLQRALKRSDAPFVNRALSAYSVGSIFKLVTASAALESGFSVKYMYDCTGAVSVYNQRFHCHKQDGHGLLDMQHALIQSCNPYFISLSRLLTPEAMHGTADALGFGKPVVLADGLVSDAGYLQSVQELQIEAEKANMSFGQGKLLATPLQIAAMTACIVHDGIYTEPHLIRGLTADGISLSTEYAPDTCRAVSSDTAAKVRRMMVSVLERSSVTNGKPANVRAGGKTSTAQTGQYDENGTELCHAWMTGFFPVNGARYTVTVFVENGGSGNQAAAPLFREIIEQMTDAGL